MGVNIKDIVEKKTIRMEDLSKKPVVFDGFNILYQFLASVRQYDGTPLTDSKNRITSHLSGLFYRNNKFLEAGIKPIYVFDGKPPDFKRMTLEKRQQRKSEAEKKFIEATDLGEIEQMQKLAKQKIRLTTSMIEEAKELLTAMGIPIVQAPSEGEAQAAYMAKEGYAYASVSQDYDSLLFGAPKLIRNLSITGKRHHIRGGTIDIKPEVIELNQVLETLNITREQLIWLGILIGTDFNEGVKGIGPKKGLKIVKECKNIEQVKEKAWEAKKYQFPEDIENVQQFFLNPPTTDDFKLKWKIINKNKTMELLVEEHDFSEDRIESSINKIENIQQENNKQKDISDFF